LILKVSSWINEECKAQKRTKAGELMTRYSVNFIDLCQ
jgi:hypothetical protein